MTHKTCTIQAGNFKAKCLQLMDEVNEKHINIIITKHGKPVAKLIPYEEHKSESFGCLKNTATIKQDIVGPIDVSWEAEDL
jgi:prevent-host-death family protein